MFGLKSESWTVCPKIELAILEVSTLLTITENVPYSEPGTSFAGLISLIPTLNS